MKAVITTIQAPTECTKHLISCLNGDELIVIGDTKTPDYKIDGATYYSICDQKSFDFEIIKNLPEKNYTRKNIGYLLAMKDNDLIYETDDDNKPNTFWKIPKLNNIAEIHIGGTFLNVYKHFTTYNIWPRGLPLEYINLSSNTLSDLTGDYVIQQGLVDESPDVDAIWRMMYNHIVDFTPNQNITTDSYVPFNAQNTWWFKKAFPLMYLPSTCTFRMTDIWRSFIAQRCLKPFGERVLFTKATAIQIRNKHNIYEDFKMEVDGYVGNIRFVDVIDNIKMTDDIYKNLHICYSGLIRDGFFAKGEIKILEAWINDCKKIL